MGDIKLYTGGTAVIGKLFALMKMSADENE